MKKKKPLLLLTIMASCILLGIFVRKHIFTQTVEPLTENSTYGQDNSTNLLAFIQEIAPLMDRLPYQLISFSYYTDFSYDRFRGTLTFDRYLLFYRFKSRVLNASRDEFNECVSHLETATSKEKALILVAFYILDQTRHSEPNVYADKNWDSSDRQVYQHEGKSPKLMTYSHFYRLFERRRDLNGLSKASFKSFPNDVVYRYRIVFLLGKPYVDSSITEDDWRKWTEAFQKYCTSDEIAFPSVEYVAEKFDLRMNTVLGKIVFFAKVYPILDDELESHSIWNRWREGIEDCVQFINDELELSITPAEWLLGDDEVAKLFLQRVAQLEKTDNVSREKVEKFRAMREYWLTFRTPDFLIKMIGFSCRPIIDFEDNDVITLGDIVRCLDDDEPEFSTRKRPKR